MFRDFTLKTYHVLLKKLFSCEYKFQTFFDFINHPEDKVILLRHDVDDRKEHSLQFACIQHELGIVGTYYFRMIPQSFDEEVVKEIAGMGHEIGYHYEDMDFAKGDPHKAIKLFEENLSRLREVADVKTICMHGSPLSKYDNRDLWKHYNYRDYGLLAEPYFDLDFSKVLYLTDTGRRWDGEGVSIRDKALEGERIQNSKSKIQNFKPQLNTQNYKSTQQIINAAKSGNLPDQIMFNFHPQRWTDSSVKWTQELVMQNVKNVVKWGIVRWRSL
ncbi:MAG: hypothetical protein WED59_00135 [Candidatus Woykebacteria bacterium]